MCSTYVVLHVSTGSYDVLYALKITESTPAVGAPSNTPRHLLHKIEIIVPFYSETQSYFYTRALMDFVDDIDQWLQATTIGDFAERCPVEATISASMIFKCSSSSPKVTDDLLLEICSSLGRMDPDGVDVSLHACHPNPSSDINGISACLAGISFELNNGMNTCASEAYPLSMGEGVEFIADLQSVADEFEQKFGVQSKQLMEAAKDAHANAAAAHAAVQQAERNAYLATQQYQQLQREFDHFRSTNTAPISTSGSSPAPPVGKINPFKSAKDQFTKEGGKFQNHEGVKRKSESSKSGNNNSSSQDDKDELPPELAAFDKALVERIEADIIHHGQPVRFQDIAGLEFAKKCVTELICWPMSRPDLFQGLRALPRGLLLFGPPGTGKTLIGKAVAHETGSTFFSISSSSLMSKWIGEGEKTVRTLFGVAAYRQPSVVFIDEVDSLLCARSSEENEASRRIKTEFMVQLDGAGTDQDARVVIIGATNRPEELDEAVRRRFVKRIYIPLPDEESRRQLFSTLLATVRHGLHSEDDMRALVAKTGGFSGADIRSLCTEAAMGPVRDLQCSQQGGLQRISVETMPAISLTHFEAAFDSVLPSVSQQDLQRYIDWNALYGSFRKMS